MSLPIGLAPTGSQLWAHPDGDIGTTRAAEAYGTVAISSAHASTSMEDIAKQVPDALRWQHLYPFGIR